MPPFLAFPLDARRIIDTKAGIEALSARLRRAVRAPRGHFPWDEAALKLLVLVLSLADRGGLARAPGAIRFEECCQTA